jgi:hypothetical protein
MKEGATLTLTDMIPSRVYLFFAVVVRVPDPWSRAWGDGCLVHRFPTTFSSQRDEEVKAKQRKVAC